MVNTVSTFAWRIFLLSTILGPIIAAESKSQKEEEHLSNGYYLDGLNEVAAAARYVFPENLCIIVC